MKKIFVFQKTCLKVKVLKTLERFTDCHINTYRSLKRRVILKIPSTLFTRIYALAVGFKMKTRFHEKPFLMLRQNPTQVLP